MFVPPEADVKYMLFLWREASRLFLNEVDSIYVWAALRNC